MVLLTFGQRRFVTLAAFVLCVAVGSICAQGVPNPIYTLSGAITEEKTSETVIGALVTLYSGEYREGSAQKPLRGAYTNKYGFYSLSGISQGAYTLVVRRVGYRTVRRSVSVTDSPLTVSVALTAQDARLQEVSVQADRQRVAAVSSVDVSMEFIRQMPALGGERDIFRTLQFLPGVKAGSEISSGLYIRGGSPDQNLILLDGVTVYNPQHLGGFLSAFNPDAVSNVRLIKGAFPAEYGGRLSSVIDLTMKEGSKENLSGAAGISLISAKALIEGPINENASFMLTGRRMYFDLVALAADPNGQTLPRYNFYDFNAKINYRLDENNHVFASGYFGRDALPRLNRPQDATFELGWGNATGNLRWTHIFSPSLFSAFSLIYTNYDFRYGAYQSQNSGGAVQFETATQIRDFTFKGELQWFPLQGHAVKTGIEVTHHDFTVNLLNSTSILQGSPLAPSSTAPLQRAQTLEAGAFVQDEWEITDALSANIGARVSYFQSIGPDAQGAHLRFEPRMSVAYKLTDDVTIKGAYAVASQFLHLLQENTVALPTDTWFPSTARLQPGRSIQYVAGVESYLFNREFLLTVEGYYKSMENLYEFREGARFVPGTIVEDLLTKGTGEAYGVEFFLNKQVGAFTGWLGYTLSWTTRLFPELNGGKPFFPRYDRRHDIVLALTYKLSEKWEIGATWTYATGQAYTMPVGITDYSLTPTGLTIDRVRSLSFGSSMFSQQYGARNAFRLPDYHRLDLNFMYKFTWFNLPFEASFNIYNAYNRLNPFTVWIEARNNLTQLRQFTLLPFLATIGLSFKF